jgi:hypothetical protein
VLASFKKLAVPKSNGRWGLKMKPKCAIQSINILNDYPMFEGKKKRPSIKEVINMNIPWAHFDDTSQGKPPVGGSRGILYL